MSRLADSVEPKQLVRLDLLWKNPAKPYQGEIVDNTFIISRIIRYRNSFLPTITGVVERAATETVVRVKIRSNPFLMGSFCLIFGLFGWFGQKSVTNNGDTIGSVLLLPIGMALFAYVVAMAAFTYESTEAREDIQRIVEGEIVD